MSILGKIGYAIFVNRTGIFIGSGLLFGVACVTTACVQTVKACDIIEDANERMDELESIIDNNPEASNELIEQTNADIKKIRKETNLKLVKNYIIPTSFGVASVVCILAAYKILSSQKAAALAALSSVSAAFDKYRSRVVDKYGEEEDYNLYMGRTETEVTKEITDPKTGKKKTVKETVVTTDPIDNGCYSYIFSSVTAPGEWCFNQKLCVARLQHCEDDANRRLMTKGWITLNNIRESLGLDCSVGYYGTEKPMPNNIGWVSREILDAVSDKFPGPYDDTVRFAPVISSNYFDDGITHYDGSYRLDFNCYPKIDEMIAYYEEKKKRGLVKKPD